MVIIMRSLTRSNLFLIVLLLVAFPAGVLALTQILPEATVETEDRKSTRLNSSHIQKSRMPSSA